MLLHGDLSVPLHRSRVCSGCVCDCCRCPAEGLAAPLGAPGHPHGRCEVRVAWLPGHRLAVTVRVPVSHAQQTACCSNRMESMTGALLKHCFLVRSGLQLQ